MKPLTLVNCDTDSITVCKPDGSPFSEEEQTTLLKQLNEQFPERIRWEPDGYFPAVCVLKAKNYILYDGKKIKIKGSALKDSKASPALREFMNAIVDAIIFEKGGYSEIYMRYVKEILDVKDIKRWSSRKTLSSTMIESDRTNETRVMDALVGSNYVEGDRFYTFFESPEKITLTEKFNGNYDKDKLLSALYKKSEIFSTVLDKTLFINYSLKKNRKLLNLF
jgi:DNA polymerase elongation subunit (family B)